MRKPGAKHGSHRDERARELDLAAQGLDSDVDHTGDRRDAAVAVHRRGC